MAKQTQLDKAIAQLEGERAILDAAIAKLRQQQAKQPVRRARVAAKPTPAVEDGRA